MGRILAYCLSDLPYLEHIDLNDNLLTDDSLQYIIQAIIAISTIRVLNLSRNKIDGYSSTALAEYVARPDCPIETLILQCADVDDGECADFVQNLVTNEKLVELDLSANLLGSASGGGGGGARETSLFGGLTATTTTTTTTTSAAMDRKTVILSIHQPRYDIFAAIDEIILLSRGHVVWAGNSQQ
eukprot:gene43374-54360_t